MTLRPSINDLDAWLALKPGGHFTVSPWGTGYAVTVRRPAGAPETILCETEAEANRHRLPLSDAGLVGYRAEPQ